MGVVTTGWNGETAPRAGGFDPLNRGMGVVTLAVLLTSCAADGFDPLNRGMGVVTPSPPDFALMQVPVSIPSIGEWGL